MPFLFEGQTILHEENETVLEALLRHGKAIKYQCKIGACQSCLLRGRKDTIPSYATDGLSEDLIEEGYFLSCKAPASEVEDVCLPSAEIGKAHPAKIVGWQMLTADVLHLRLRPDEPFSYLPGRFIRLEVNGILRSYSIASGPNCEELDLHIRLIEGGAMSTALSNKSVLGLRVEIYGQFGACSYRATSKDQPLLLIGSGTGLAPLYGILLHALSEGHSGEIALYHGTTTPERLYFQEELHELTRVYKNFTYHPCADAAHGAETVREGSPLSIALKDHPNLEGWRVYACGHPELVKHTKRKVYISGVDLRHIHADAFEDQSGSS